MSFDLTNTAATWRALNPILPLGVRGIETDTRREKLGNRTTAWINLPYVDGAQTARARALLAGLPTVVLPETASSLSPTVTLGTNNASSTITNAVRISPARLTSTVIDTTNDPSFTWIGVKQGEMIVSSSDMAYSNLMIGGAAQAARWRTRVRFFHTGQQFDAYYRTRGTPWLYRIWVNGQALSTALVSNVVTVPGRYHLLVDFGSTATRLIELEVNDPEFGGIYIEPTASVSRAPRKPLMVGFGDSITQGANGLSPLDTWPRFTAQILGLDYVNLGIGGTGFLSASGAFTSRIPDIVSLNPEIVVVFGSFNDASSQTQSQIQAAANTCFSTLKAQLPSAVIVAVGCWMTTDTRSAAAPTLDAADAGVKAAAVAQGIPFVSVRDPLDISTSTLPWTASTAYVPGNLVTANGLVWRCIIGHTSSSSFSGTNWRATSFITGTGKVGTTTGDGNADVFIQSDGTHPSATAHEALGRFLAARLTSIITSIAGL